MFMINVTQDQVIPRASTEALWTALGKPDIKWYDGNHEGLAVHLFDTLQIIGKFFDK